MKRFFIVFAITGSVATAVAHPVAQGSMEFVLSEKAIALRARVSPEEVIVENNHAPRPADTLPEAYRQHAHYLLRHLRILADDRELKGTVTGISPPEAGTGEGYAIYDFEFPIAQQVRSLHIAQDVLNEFDYAPGNRWEASFVVRVLDRRRILTEGALLTSRTPLSVSAEARPSPWPTARAYIRHGVTHILTGYDHLLFISALALAFTTFWELFKVIAAFTLAHTITLTLSVLDLVRLSSHIVEPMIAASIIFVALQNTFWPQRTRGAARLSIAFCFGLFHGLGFAGGLRDAMSGMPGVAIALAILCFSLGVELGHQCVVLPIYAVTKFVRLGVRGMELTTADRRGEWLLRGGSALISAAGAFYLVAALRE